MNEDEIREIGGTAGRDIARKPGAAASPLSGRIKEYFASEAAHANFMAGFNEGMAGSPFAQTLFAGRPFKDGEKLDDFAHWEVVGGKMVLSKDLPADHDAQTCEECARMRDAVNRFTHSQHEQGRAIDIGKTLRDDDIVDAEIVEEPYRETLLGIGETDPHLRPLGEGQPMMTPSHYRDADNLKDFVEHIPLPDPPPLGRFSQSPPWAQSVPSSRISSSSYTCRPGMSHARECALTGDEECACGCRADDFWCMANQSVDSPRENRWYTNEEGVIIEDVSLAGNGLLDASLRGDVGSIVRAAPTNATSPTEKGWTAQSARRQQWLDSIPDDMTEEQYTLQHETSVLAEAERARRAVAYEDQNQAQLAAWGDKDGKHPTETTEAETTSGQDASGEAEATSTEPTKLSLSELVGAEVIGYGERGINGDSLIMMLKQRGVVKVESANGEFRITKF